MSTKTKRRRKKQEAGPALPLPKEQKERIVARKGRHNFYVEIRKDGKLLRRSTGTRIKASAEQWLALAKKHLDRTGTLPTAKPVHIAEVTA